ncbi:uncharacterized protein LOC117158996 [Bombus vancouverensis nearcticus]|uniref:uncharacterized protein LOC117158996 n=1 Tax=Bombus vancouverensis nearcticus TaxID=2705178 RepID=UPI00402BC784
MNNVQDKTVLITGGGSGLGLVYAERLLQDGAKVVAIIDLEIPSVEIAVSQLEVEFGKGTAKYFPCDVSNAEQFEATFKKVWDTLGGLDILINNAGLLNDLKWQQTIGVNINGVIQGSLLALDYMGKHKGGKGGTIVNIASIMALKIFPEVPIYCTTKHTVLAFSRCIQEHFDKTGVRVLVLCPGATATPILDEMTEKSLDFVEKNAVKTMQESLLVQPTQHVGRGMVQFLLKGENGAVWVIENKKPPYAVEFPPFKKVENMQIKDKRVIVTGAAGGLGMTISRELLRNGASVIAMIDIEEVAGKEAMNVLNAEFGRNRAIFFQCDVANNSEFDDTFKRAVKTLGGLEILVNNAGIINESDFTKTIDVNVTAVIRATLLGIQQMQKDSGGKGGVIVNISSVAGLYSLSQLPVYSATKHAVVSFSRSFAQPYHYERTGVRIIVLCPELSQMSNVKNSEVNPSQDQLIQKYFRRVDSVAHGLVYVVRCAQNGSIWISEDGKPVYEIQLFDSLPQKHNDSILEENERKMQID